MSGDERLAHMGETIKRVSEQVAELEQCLAELECALSSNPSEAAHNSLQLSEHKVRQLICARRIREQQLGGDLFADPAWDILLEALAAELGEKPSSVTQLCGASAVPATTAMRWISKLEQDGWLARQPQRRNADEMVLKLTVGASEKLRRYFEAIAPTFILV